MARRRTFRSKARGRSRRSRYRSRRRLTFRKTRKRFRKGRRMRRGGMSRALRFLLPKPLTWVKTSSQTILGLQGICKWAMLEPCLDWQDMSDTAGKTSQSNLTIAGSTYNNVGLDHMVKVSAHYEILNTSLAYAQIEAYYCVPRRDIPDDQFGRGIHTEPGSITAINGNTIYHIFNRSTQNTVNLEASTTAYPGGTSSYETYFQHPQFQPFHSPEFCRLFKIYKTQRFQLAAGKRVALTVKSGYRRIPNDVLQRGTTDNQGYSYFRGTGRFILLKIHGQVVTKDDVTTTTANPSAQVTYATTAFAVAATKRLRTTPIYGSIKLFSYDMAGINATDTPIAEKIPATVINEASTGGEATNDGA